MSISNTLILISLATTILATINPDFYNFWMNLVYLNIWDYTGLILQFILYQFLHWWILHLFSNSIFIYLFWNPLESLIWKKKFLIFFVLSSIFVWVLLLLFSSWNTIWISGFCMALLSYYTLELYKKWNPEYKWWITAIILNIAIWFVPWISLVWHLFWAIAWIIFFGIMNLKKKKTI